MDETKYLEDGKPQKPHPFEKANIFSRIFFCWLLPDFVKGFKKPLTEDDMYGPLKTHESSILGDKLEAAWKYQLKHKKDPSLGMAIFSVFKVDLAYIGILYLFSEFLIKLAQPLVMPKLLSYYEANQSSSSNKSDAYVYAAILILTTLINVLCAHTYQLTVLHVGMKIRVAACSLIYRKALKLSNSALAGTTIGQMVNLLSNDVSRFDHAAQRIHNLWGSPLETVIVMYLLYVYVGVSGLVGTVFLLLMTPFQSYMGRKTSQYRLRTAVRTDERVRLMSEIILGIQVIKMYTWEKPFAKLIAFVRRKEIQQIRMTSTIRALVMSFGLVLSRAAIYFCILTYVLTGNLLDASYVYTITSFYGILRNVVTMAFPRAIMQFSEAKVSVRRVKKFLLYEEIMSADERNSFVDDNRSLANIQNGKNGTLAASLKPKEVGVRLKDASFKWLTSLPDNTLQSITFDVNSTELVAVVGPVGGGKTTLLHAILKELPPVEGSVDVTGFISYASQESWLFGGSVRQNIVFGQEFNNKKYDEVIRICALERDFSMFPHGDRSLIGERGVTLSGGQRARINLARAIYKDADIYLLDDPLSAVDTHVGRQLFDECICGYLKDKCVVLVTHQLQYLRNVSKIYLLEDGKVAATGSYEELKAKDSEFTQLLSESQAEDEENEKVSKEVTEKTESNTNGVLQVQEREQRSTGSISGYVYKNYVKAGGGWLKCTLLFFVFILAQVCGSCTDYFVTIWVNLQQWRLQHGMEVPMKASWNDTMSNDTFVESVEVSKDDSSFQSIMNLILTEQTAIIAYSFLVLATIVVTIARSIWFFRYCMSTSTILHDLMFNRVVYATMRFFNSNSSGRILNRFSKDIGAVDETLPPTIIDTIQTGLTVVGVSVVVSSLNPWILIPTFIILTIFYFLRVVFLATSRNIKRVEAITRSPIYTHLSASLQGLTTVRAFGAEDILTQEFDNFQNKHSAAYFLFLGATRTFGMWLDLHCVIYVTLVTINVLFTGDEVYAGNVGLALTQALSLTGRLQMGIRQWSELENQMTSVERVQEYIDLTPESDEATKEPPKFWPEKGKVKFDGMSLRYSPDDAYVLKNVVFEIEPKEKVGIVGRTGAGKSSLIAALFRLTEIDGKILIDDVDTKTVPLNSLRSKISIIPQEPVLFSGTLRKNLDPFDEYSDDVLWNALDEVELKNAVNDLPAGLESKMSEGGSNLSVGQRQLVCLARAIIRNNRILVLDEATANVDPYTDGLIQTTIRQKFADCTVLTIAHRLHTIMDSDKVLVMDAGQAVEFDHPHVLLQDVDGIFYGLVMETGKGMAENLTAIAEENYRKVVL